MCATRSQNLPRAQRKEDVIRKWAKCQKKGGALSFFCRFPARLEIAKFIKTKKKNEKEADFGGGWKFHC